MSDNQKAAPLADAYQDDDGRVWMNLRKHPEGWPGAYDFDSGCTPLSLHDADEVAHLRRWKAEALPVMSGLQELGRALGVGLGKSITARESVDLALDLRNDRDRFQAANREHIDRIDVLEADLVNAQAALDVYNQTNNDRLAAVVNAEIRAEDAEAERDALAARLAAVEAILAAWDAWDGSRGPDGRTHPDASTPADRDRLRAALHPQLLDQAPEAGQ